MFPILAFQKLSQSILVYFRVGLLRRWKVLVHNSWKKINSWKSFQQTEVATLHTQSIILFFYTIPINIPLWTLASLNRRCTCSGLVVKTMECRLTTFVVNPAYQAIFNKRKMRDFSVIRSISLKLRSSYNYQLFWWYKFYASLCLIYLLIKGTQLIYFFILLHPFTSHICDKSQFPSQTLVA